jgi:hypothetical protein
MKKEEKKKPAKYMIHKRFFLVCVPFSLKKNALREIKEKRRRMQMFPVCLVSNTFLCKPPNPPMRKNTTGKVERRKMTEKEICDRDSKSAQTALPKGKKFREKKRVKEGRSLNRNEKSWSQKCVAGTKHERRETLVVQSGKIVASLFSHTSSLAAMMMIL